nr:hypothetical protein BdHM001_35830 [Bdellovibrio sp. HM001]
MMIYQLLMSIALAASSVCKTDGAGTTCSSPDMTVINTLSNTLAPVSNVVVNNPSNNIVSVSNEANTVPLNLRVFTSNNGISQSLNIDLAGKWDPATGTQGVVKSPNAGSAIVLGDVFNNVNINVAGYAGKRAADASEICAEKMKSGFYGEAAYDAFISRCADGSAGPCSPENLRSRCDAVDVSTIQSNSDQFSEALCAEKGAGFNTIGQDGVSSPAVRVTKLVPRTLKKCVRPPYIGGQRKCARKSTTCRLELWAADSEWHSAFQLASNQTYVHKTKGYTVKYDDFSMPSNSTWTPEAQRTEAFKNWYLKWWCSGCYYPKWIANIQYTVNYHASVTDNICLPPQFAYNFMHWIATPENTSQDKTYYYKKERPPQIGANIGGYFDGALTDYQKAESSLVSPANVVNPGRGITFYMHKMAETELKFRLIDDTLSCEAYERDDGLQDAVSNPSSTVWVEPGSACPGGAGARPPYDEVGLFTDHGRTNPFANPVNPGQSINPVERQDNANCTKASCPGVAISNSNAERTSETINLGAGEEGSFGGKATVLAYDIKGLVNVNFSNGAHGRNGEADISADPLIKNCAQITGDNTHSPVVNFYQVDWKPFKFNASSVIYPVTFPVRTQEEAVSIWKRSDPMVRGMLRRHLCPTCP